VEITGLMIHFHNMPGGQWLKGQFIVNGYDISDPVLSELKQ